MKAATTSSTMAMSVNEFSPPLPAAQGMPADADRYALDTGCGSLALQRTTKSAKPDKYEVSEG
jgi:hypothetical protein